MIVTVTVTIITEKMVIIKILREEKQWDQSVKVQKKKKPNHKDFERRETVGSVSKSPKKKT